MKTNFVKIAAASLILATTLLVKPIPAYAQQDNLKNDQSKQDNQLIAHHDELIGQNSQVDAKYQHQDGKGKQHDGKKNIEAQRIAYITKELDLTPDESKVFWPVYNEYDAKRQKLKKSFKESGDFHKPDFDKLTEKEANQILDNQIIEAQKFLDLRKEYHTKFRSVLPAVKVLKLYDAEREFQKMLLDKMRQHKQSPPPSDKK
jgi:hypothetical protein